MGKGGRFQGFFSLGWHRSGGERGQLSRWTCCFGEAMAAGRLTRNVQQAGRNMGAEPEREHLEGIFFL